MKGLLNLLTVLVALVDLSCGCGLSGRTNRVGLLGKVLTGGSLRAGSAGMTLASGLGPVLGGRPRGVLLGGLRGALGSRLFGAGTSSGASLPVSSGAVSAGVAAGLGALGTSLGASTTGGLLGSIQRIATGIGAGASSGGCRPGSACAGSGQPLGQRFQHASAAVATGLVVAGSTAVNSATGLGGHNGGNSAGGFLGVAGSQGSGPFPGGVSSGGSQPIPSAPGSGGAPGALAAVSGVSSTVGLLGSLARPSTVGFPGGVSSDSPIPGSSPTGSGGIPVPGFGQTSQQSRQEFAGASVTTVGGVSTLGTALGGHPGGTPTGNPMSGDLGVGSHGSGNGVSSGGISGPGFPASTNPVERLGQGVEQTGGTFSGTSLVAAGGVSTLATGLGVHPGGNSAGNPSAVPANLGGIAHGNGVPSAGIGSPSVASGANPVLGLGQVSQQTGQAFDTRSLIAMGAGSTSTTGLGGQLLGENPAGNPLAGSTSHGGGISGNSVPSGGSGLPSSGAVSGAGLGATLATGTVETVLGAVGAGGLGVPGTTGGSAPGPSGVGSGPSIPGDSNQMPGLGHSPQQNGQVLGAASLTASSATWRSETSIGAGLPGRPTGSSPSGATSPRDGGSGGGAPIGGIGPGSSASGSGAGLLGTVLETATGRVSLGGQGTPAAGTNQGPGLGQSPQQSVQTIHGAFAATAASWSSAAHTRTQLPGSNAGNLPGVPTSPISGIGTSSSGSVLGAGAGLLGTVLGSARKEVSLGALVTPAAGIAKPSPQQHLPGQAPAAAAALTGLAGALAATALGASIASAAHGAMQAGVLGRGQRAGGCSRSRSSCGSGGCGRKRRSISQSKVQAEVLNSIPMNFDRLS